MNMISAVKGLTNGQAAKPAMWRGYVERVDKALEQEYSDKQSSYPVKSKVTYNGSRYICISAVTSAEPFDGGKWVRIDSDRYIVFVDAADTDPQNTPNPSAIYLLTVQDAEGSLGCTRLESTDDVPAEVKAVHSWTGKCPSPVNMPDAELFLAMLSDTWESASAKDYEAQRVGGSGRW